jgi:RimJ/RimL family protein N-acetyltransferase
VTSPEALRVELADGAVRLVPFGEAHVEPLRAACAEDTEIWEIYPYSMLGEHFDAAMAMRSAKADWAMFAACLGEHLIGTTNFIRPDFVNGCVEIGGTYFTPRVRGTDYNRRAKKLMIDHAFANGFRRIEFRVDERNGRSRAAVLKLGATHEGTLRRDRMTWTGHMRNTCIFGLLREEWRG